MAVILGNNLLRLLDLNPLVRNTNTADDLQEKAGPNAIARTPDGSSWRIFFEGVGPLQASPFDFRTAIMDANATVLQAWTVSPSTRVDTPGNNTTWENYEFSPSSAWWDAANNQWVIWAHGGNNSGTRKIGVAYSTDGVTGQAFSRDGGNPILSPGSAGAFDDKWIADLKIRSMPDGTFLGFYRGVKTGGPANGTIGRVTGTVPQTLTKQGEVITQGAASSWNELGVNGGGWVKDPDGRIHIFVAGWNASNVDSIGYYYSDDNGATFTQYGSNPVLSSGGATKVDLATGDVVQAVDDGDVLFLTYGGENSVDYPTNPPIRAICAAITPYRKTSPSRKGKFYLPSSYTTVTGTGLVSNTVFSVCGRFRAYRIDRTKYREIYTEEAAFNITAFIRIEGGGGANAGKIGTHFRTPTGESSMVSTSTYDDGLWHTLLVRRTATNAFELWVDGTQVATDATTVGTDATASTKAVGNWNPGTGEPDEPSYCTISDVVTIVGTALTWGQAELAIEKRRFPVGVSPTVNFPLDGTDTGDVALVEAGFSDAALGGAFPLQAGARIRPRAFAPGLAR